jgi:hypothetical protein
MKIKDIISESTGELHKHQRFAMRGLNKFTDGKKWNSDYTLYRLGLALAATDGKTMPDMDEESWLGKWKLTAPFTKEEQEMLKLAYKQVHANYEDINHGDMRSQEGPTINKESPVPKRKKNRFGV